MKRLYGYHKSKAIPGGRFQGQQVVGVLEDSDAEVTPTAEDGEVELEINSRAATEIGVDDPTVKLMGKAATVEEPEVPAAPVAAPKPEVKTSKKVEPKKAETKSTKPVETGELPDHLTGFMDTDNLQPTISSTTTEESDPEAE